MIEAVFISDLHLHPEEVAITKRFEDFIEWASTNTKKVYILGDFFHVWPGDDAFDAWSLAIAHRLATLAERGVQVFFITGNRDFLLGNLFAKQSNSTILVEPTVINLDETRVLLVHGDRYCLNDKSHQWFRRLTRNAVFRWLFLRIPLSMRCKIVNRVRYRSEINRNKPIESMQIVASALLNDLERFGAEAVIHGHIHKVGHTTHVRSGTNFQQFVLSDWDESPSVLCYNKSTGLYFELLQAR